MAADEELASPWGEGGRTVRFALETDDRTIRLAMLIVVVAICWHLML